MRIHSNGCDILRRTKRSGNFFLCLLINISLNLEWLIPIAILIGLHFFLGISIWWGIGLFVFWLLYIIFWMKIIGWADKSSCTPDKTKENKNPYSAGKYTPYNDK